MAVCSCSDATFRERLAVDPVRPGGGGVKAERNVSVEPVQPPHSCLISCGYQRKHLPYKLPLKKLVVLDEGKGRRSNGLDDEEAELKL